MRARFRTAATHRLSVQERRPRRRCELPGFATDLPAEDQAARDVCNVI